MVLLVSSSVYMKSKFINKSGIVLEYIASAKSKRLLVGDLFGGQYFSDSVARLDIKLLLQANETFRKISVKLTKQPALYTTAPIITANVVIQTSFLATMLSVNAKPHCMIPSTSSVLLPRGKGTCGTGFSRNEQRGSHPCLTLKTSNLSLGTACLIRSLCSRYRSIPCSGNFAYSA